MSLHTSIAWCDATFNPWIGCTKVSAGCAHCYAEADFDRRKHVAKWGAGQPRHRTSPAYWKEVLKWEDDCARFNIRRRVFCASLADWLDDEIPIEWLADLLEFIHCTPHLDWLLLTKRPQNWRPRMELVSKMNPAGLNVNFADSARHWLEGWAPANVWLGTSAELQPELDIRAALLCGIPARVRFLSGEPLLGPLNLTRWFYKMPAAQGIHWVICRGESGPEARPMHPDWARGLRDQCESARVPFFFKQWGTWAPGTAISPGEWAPASKTRKNVYEFGATAAPCMMHRVSAHVTISRLDGRIHTAFP